MAAHQAPPSLGFSRQEYWSGLPLPSPMHESEKWKWSRSVVSNSSWPHGLQPTRLLHPWDFLRDITLLTKICLLKASSHVWIWELDYKESWVLKNCCFWTVVLEKTVESPLDCKEIQSVHPKGNQSWVFIGRTDVEAAAPIRWPPDAKSWLIWKDPDARKDWGRRRREWQRMRWYMASPTQWPWVWVNSGSWWWTGRSGVLRFMGLQRVRHSWATELSWTDPLPVPHAYGFSVKLGKTLWTSHWRRRKTPEAGRAGWQRSSCWKGCPVLDGVDFSHSVTRLQASSWSSLLPGTVTRRVWSR